MININRLLGFITYHHRNYHLS